MPSSSFWGEWRSRSWAYGAVLVLSVVLSFPTALFLEQRDLLRRHIVREAEDTAWLVFLRSHANRDFLEESLRSFPGIQSITFVSKEEAFESLQKDPVMSEGLTLAGQNPLPDSFDIRWSPFFLRADYMAHTRQKTEELEGVERVGYDEARVARLNVSQRVLYQLELGLLGLLWGTALLLVVLTGRLLFFPRGPFPAMRLLSCVVHGFFGSAAGLGLSSLFMSEMYWRVLWTGVALGVLMGVIQDAFQEP